MSRTYRGSVTPQGAGTLTTNASIVVNVPTSPEGNISSTNVQDAINELDTEKVAKAGDTMTGDLTVPNLITGGNVDGRDVSVDGTKLDTIESGATADQTAAEIKTAYESNANTNAYTDAEQTKLAGIEAGATADQTSAEIKTLYESNADTNAFTDAEKTKLGTVESGATADQSAAEIEAIVNHDNLLGFVADKHVAHSSVSISTSEGIQGGGTIAATRSLKLDINGLTTDASPDKTADYVVFYDTTEGVHNKVLIQDLPITGGQFEGTATDKAISWNTQTIGEDITIVATHNALSAGPITISTGFTVTVATGARWVIV